MRKTNEKLPNLEGQTITRLEKILTELHMDYKKLSLPDDDIVYTVEISMSLPLDEKKDILVFLLISADNKNLFLMCPNIYKLNKKDTTLQILIALNRVNSKLSGGSVTLEEDKTVIYRRHVRFDRIDSINKSKLENLFSDIVASIIYTAEEIKGIKQHE